MGLQEVFIFAGVSIVVRLAGMRLERSWLLLGVSALAVYWLQPAMPIRYLDFWLPTATLTLAVVSWVFMSSREVCKQKETLIAGGVIVFVVLVVGATRYLAGGNLLLNTRPPQISQVLAGIALIMGMVMVTGMFLPRTSRSLAVLSGFILAVFVVIKVPAFSQWAASGLRALTGQEPGLALATDIRWLGFSYVAFRLIHTIRDQQTGRLPNVSLRDYLVYVIFFPAFTAGPIDRLQRFVKDMEKPYTTERLPEDIGSGGQRLAVGIFKKFVLADSLSLIALNEVNATQVQRGGWAYLLLVAYSLVIYFDFSGYTDIAIGLGRFLGFQLPENFDRPYLKPNLTQFWNNWHITLTQWFRAYFFNPLTRFLRRFKTLPVWSIILITQLTTMVLIGMWHGVTINFLFWGIWHGLGLFVQNRLSDWLKPRTAWLEGDPWRRRLWNAAGTLLTFNFVTLGWLFFALPTPDLSWRVMVLLLGG